MRVWEILSEFGECCKNYLKQMPCTALWGICRVSTVACTVIHEMHKLGLDYHHVAAQLKTLSVKYLSNFFFFGH